ncbi:hypothetical protein Bca52824_074930 [Brassica carinata]|uniref:DUF4283 domain-containing protein n=1 Tax=Brassica carinata TaxID=52824 RepID=A0A8X7TXG3_BRACI|nr:hypothetical protein Bca52824_074930 [Brassica carinata]
MVFQNWDPGNRWKEEDNERVGVIAKIWRTEKVIKRDCDRIYLVGIRSTDFAAKDLDGEKWISISILFKMRSSDFTGINSVYSLRKNLFFQHGIRRINFGLDTIGIWSLWISWVCDEQILQKTWKGGHNHGFNCNIFGINGGKSGSGEFGNCNKYKKRGWCFTCCITYSSYLIVLSSKNHRLAVVCLIMTQSQLLGAGGDIKEGEGARKRLKISVPHFDNYALDRVVGTDLGHGKFQFDFQTEEEIEAVLKLQPYHFDYWMVALARWQSKKSQLFPRRFRSGQGGFVDLEHLRVHVVIDAFQQLCFETTVDFKGEKTIWILSNLCQLCHTEDKCPLKKENRDGNGGWQEGGKHADRARSYKGVVINGNTGYQQKERDGRDYYGKGKGKMGEETDFKWVRRLRKGTRIGQQSACHDEDSRMAVQERSSRGVSGPIGDQQLQRGSNVKATENKAVEAPEEGEIKVVEASNQQLPSQTFQEELAKTQAIGTEVISDPMDAESGLQVIQSLVGDSSTLNEDKVMDMDEIREVFLANGIDMDAVDELQECSEGEVEEAMRELDRAGNEDIHEDEALVTAVDGKGMTDVEMAKQHGTRKRLFKPAAGTAVSTKMRMASVRASPRKGTGVKSGMRQGENSKQMDAKGTSNPKPGLPKP